MRVQFRGQVRVQQVRVKLCTGDIALDLMQHNVQQRLHVLVRAADVGGHQRHALDGKARGFNNRRDCACSSARACSMHQH